MAEGSKSSRRVLVTPQELIGVEIDGRYTLESILGGGGMGVVFNTTQPNLGRPLAIKLLKFDEKTDENVLRRFERELEIVSKLSHPNIVNVIEAGRDEGTSLHYVVMERVDGVTLEHVLSSFRMKPELALDIGAQVCSALSEPHARGVVHRDVKPANIMFTVKSDGGISTKLLDFGIARSAHVEGSAKITTTSTVIGSPAYMAPEAASGDEVDPTTDLYSFGVVLYEMLAGDVPFRGSTPVAIMLRHAVESPPSLMERIPEFPYNDLSELVDRLLAKESKDRPKDARAVLDEIERIQDRHGFRHVRCKTIRGTVPESLVNYLVPREASAGTPDESFDDWGPTQTFRSKDPDAVETFDGWMVPETVIEKISGEQPVVVVPDEEPTPARPLWPFLIAALVVVGAIVFAATRERETIEIPEPTPQVEQKIARPIEEETIVVTERPDPVVEAERPEPVIETEVEKKPIVRPTKKKPKPIVIDEEQNPNVDKAFDWLKNK